MTTPLTIIDKLKQRYEELEREIYILECSDNYLFSNINGNLPRYREMQAERSEISKQLHA